MTDFGGPPAAWATTEVAWGGYGGPAPAAPAPLHGERAQIMLAMLPAYYEQSAYVRNILQAQGYEIDKIHALAFDLLPHVVDVDTCPEWALALWEVVLQVGDRRHWATADRRTAILAFFRQAVTEVEVIAFLAAQTPTDPANITLSTPTG